MAFGPEHWQTPRASIATVYRDNDLGYATHGAHAVADILRAIDLAPLAASRMRILDFGAGTARVARILSRHFGYVVAYDPQPHCIAEAIRENTRCKPLAFTNMVLTSAWDQVLKLAPFDLVCAISVFEHLTVDDQQLALDRVLSVLKPKGVMRAPGVAVLWLHTQRNAALIRRHPMRLVHEANLVGLYVLAGGPY